MSHGAIAFLCANPTPEQWPWIAEECGIEVVATGRSDFSNQVNNSLGFPGIFRGVLDVRARSISDGMGLAAAHELAAHAREPGLSPQRILPRLDDERAHVRVAVATGTQAKAEGLAQCPRLDATRGAGTKLFVGRCNRQLSSATDSKLPAVHHLGRDSARNTRRLRGPAPLEPILLSSLIELGLPTQPVTNGKRGFT